MAANVLNSKQAVLMSVYVVRAFVRLRQLLVSNKEITRKISELENKYDSQFKVVFDSIRALMTPPEKKKGKSDLTGRRNNACVGGIASSSIPTARSELGMIC